MWPGFFVSSNGVVKGWIMKSEFIEDLKFVKENIQPGVFPKRSILRNCIAPFLRKWMCDNGLRSIDSSLGKGVEVEVFINHKMLDYCKKGHAIFCVLKLNRLSC